MSRWQCAAYEVTSCKGAFVFSRPSFHLQTYYIDLQQLLNSLLSGVSKCFKSTDEISGPNDRTKTRAQRGILPISDHQPFGPPSVESTVNLPSVSSNCKDNLLQFWKNGCRNYDRDKLWLCSSYCEPSRVAGTSEVSMHAAVMAVLFKIGWHVHTGKMKKKCWTVFRGCLFTLFLTQYGN